MIGEDVHIYGFDFSGCCDTLQPEELTNFVRSRKLGTIRAISWSTPIKGFKIPFISEDRLTRERNAKNLAKAFERKGDELMLNHEGNEKDAIVIGLNRDLAIEINEEARNDGFINFEKTIEIDACK